MTRLLTPSVWLFCLSTFFAVSPVSATIEEGRFGLAENSGEWRQQELEQWLEQRLTKDIANFVPEHMFNVYVTVTFKNERNSVRRVTNVNLSKFGAVTSLVRVDGVKPHQGIFGKVSKLDVTVLVDDDVAPSTVAGIEAVIKNQIPIIDTQRINTNIVRMDRPSPGLAAWLKQFESVIATCLVTAIICLFLFYLLQNIRLSVSWSLGPPKKVVRQVPVDKRELNPGVAPVAALIGEVADGDFMPVSVSNPAPEPVVAAESDELWEDTAQTVAFRKIRAVSLSLSVDERLELLHKNKELGVVMVIALPKDKSEKLLARLNEAHRKDLAYENLKCDLKKIAANVDRYVDGIRSYKGVSRNLKEGSERVATYVEQVGPANERDVYGEMIKKNEFDMLSQTVRHSPPAEVLTHMDFEVVRAAWTHLTIEDRAVIAHLPPSWLKANVAKLVDRTDSKMVNGLVAEFSELKKRHDNLEPVAEAAHKALINQMREAYRNNEGLRKGLEPYLQAWLGKETKGVLGEDPGRKSA